MSTPAVAAAASRPGIGLWAAVSIGIGGMIGAGIFSILGVVAQVAGAALPVAFLAGGVVALLATYSYAKLGARYPTAGGAVQFLVEGLGDGVLSGGLNTFQWVGFVITLALYASGFAGYARTFLPAGTPGPWTQVFAVGIILAFTLLNSLGAGTVGKAETFIVGAKVAILIAFVAVGMWFIVPATWPSSGDVLFGAGVLFVGYEGFGLITNAAGDMANPRRLLPRALFLAVVIVIVIYVAVAATVIGTLTVPQILAARDFALAQAAKPFLGEVGFRLIGIAALLSTSSAINATVFGAANASYQIARDGELPATFTRSVWRHNLEGLYLTAGLAILFVLFFDLGPIAMMGSAAFLLVYAAVNGAHLRLYHQTGAQPALIALSLLACLAMFALLCVYVVHLGTLAPLVALVGLLALSFVAEWAYRRRTGRTIKPASAAR
ncbi:MAG TPA: APC family permease [Chloroflexota bacterium]|jgi:amino acid transporter